jgi:hypothetical protein
MIKIDVPNATLLTCAGEIHECEPKWIGCPKYFRYFWNLDCLNRHIEKSFVM